MKGKDFMKVKLESSSNEYKEVENNFKATLNSQIVAIFRIQVKD